MNILFVTDKDPNSCSNGGEQRTHALLVSLKKYGDVDTLFITNCDGVLDESQCIYTFNPQRHGAISLFDFLLHQLWRLKIIPFLPFPLVCIVYLH